MNNCYNVSEEREYYTSGPYHSRRFGIIVSKAKPHDWMKRNRAKNVIGRVWQQSARSWRYSSGSNSGKAKTFDEAVQKVLRGR